MMGLGDVNIREASTIRFIQAVAAGLQAVMGVAGFGDIVPAKWAFGIMAATAFLQFFLTSWNSGLHNDPAKPYTPPKLP